MAVAKCREYPTVGLLSIFDWSSNLETFSNSEFLVPADLFTLVFLKPTRHDQWCSIDYQLEVAIGYTVLGAAHAYVLPTCRQQNVKHGQTSEAAAAASHAKSWESANLSCPPANAP